MSQPTRRSARVLTLGLLAVATLVLASPATADWLVLVDGSRVESDGPWEQRGNLIVFTGEDGKLLSLRLAEVDLDASRRATSQAEMATRPTPTVPPPPRPSVLKLTDADVGHVYDEDEAEAGSDPGTNGSGADSAANDVVVRDWSQEEAPNGEGQVIRGTVENRGEAALTTISVLVTAYDVNGVELGSTLATLGSRGLMPGETTSLAAAFPDVFDISAVRFNVQHQSFAVRSEGEENEESDSADEG